MRALIGVAAAVVLLVVPSSGVAQAPLPVGEAHGVRVVRERGGIVVVFTERAAKRYERIAGRLVEVECTNQGIDRPGRFTEESGGSVTLRAPKRRRQLVTGDGTRGLDYCRVWLPARTVRRGDGRVRIPRRLIVSVPLTQSGAVFLDEELRARRLLQVLTAAAFVDEELKLSGWASYAQLVDKLGPAKGRLVSLASPTDTPPARTIGYYSDGREHVAVATLSRSGRRLFIEGAADDVLSTNVSRYIFGDR